METGAAIGPGDIAAAAGPPDGEHGDGAPGDAAVAGDLRYSWDDAGVDASHRRALCEALRVRGYALVSMPGTVASAADQAQRLGVQFFSQPRDQRALAGSFRLYKNKVVGYRELGGGASRFLELHALAAGGTRVGCVPNPKTPPGLRDAVVQLLLGMQAMARSLLSWMAEHAGVPPEALLQVIDEAGLGNVEPGDCGASVLRLCCYGLGRDGEEAPDARFGVGHTVEGRLVAFDEHTDASFVTLAPVGTEPGLQMRDPSTGLWLDIERGLPAAEGCLVAFVGDFVEVLTKGFYRAAVHRVVQQELLADGSARAVRFSMPFLVRGQPEACIDTTSFLGEEAGDGQESALDVPLRRLNIKVNEMRRFLDMKGQRRFTGQRLLDGRPAE